MMNESFRMIECQNILYEELVLYLNENDLEDQTIC